MATAVQMNVRIDPSLKEQGDRILAQHGMSPSQAIRAFYSSLVGTKEQSERIFQAMDPSLEDPEKASRKDAKLSSVRRIQQKIASLNEDIGINPRSAIFERISDKELLEIAVTEAYGEEELA